MGGCAAVNCSNSTEKGFRLFRFPSNPERRKKWIINCRRSQWVPSSNSKLCEVHFEHSQFENHREDNWRKLKQNAVPTLFDVPYPPKTIDGKRKKGSVAPKSGSILEDVPVNENVPDLDQQRLINENAALRERVKQLEKQLEKAETQCSELESKVRSFLTEEQMKYLGENKNSIPKWSIDELKIGYELLFNLGKQGYQYLRSTGYPAPAYSTLTRHRIGSPDTESESLNDS